MSGGFANAQSVDWAWDHRLPTVRHPYAWVDQTPLPVVVTDGAGRVLMVNSAFETLFAIDRSCLPSEPVEDLIIASRFRSAYRAARRLALTGVCSVAAGDTNEFVASHADGGEFSADVSIGRTSEDPLWLATWIRDLTEDRTVAPQATECAVLYERAEHLAGFGTWDWTPDSDRMLWSDNLFRIYGLHPGEIAPAIEYTIAHCHPDDQERVRRATARLARTGRSSELRYRYIWPDGTVRYVSSTVASVAESDGLSRSMIGTVQDLTEQREAEREIAAHFAVSDALSDWEPGTPGARRLVRDLAESLEYQLGVMFVPRGSVLAAWVVWQERPLHSPARASALSEVRLGRGVGLAGRVWASGEPARVDDLTNDPADGVREIATRAEIRGGLAVPATYGKEVLAVFAFGSRRQAVLSDRFMRSLVGIGYEIGHFLARRRSELSAPALTPRELEVLQLSATGYARRRVAEEIDVTEATVKTHLENIYRKLGVPDRASAVGVALRQGIIH